MKLNCDMGESFGPWKMGMDEQVMPLVDMANIACGFHASDPMTMTRTVRLAMQHQVQIGAHPGYPDLVGFGRRNMSINSKELRAILLYQMGALEAICQAEGSGIHYVKPHGALYNNMMSDHQVLAAVMSAVAAFSRPIPLMLMAIPNSAPVADLAEEHGISLLFEAFSDRAYTDEGFLVPRHEVNAVHQSTDAIKRQVRQLLDDGSVTSVNGKRIPLHADTICLHGDNPLAVEAAARIRSEVWWT